MNFFGLSFCCVLGFYIIRWLLWSNHDAHDPPISIAKPPVIEAVGSGSPSNSSTRPKPSSKRPRYVSRGVNVQPQQIPDVAVGIDVNMNHRALGDRRVKWDVIGAGLASQTVPLEQIFPVLDARTLRPDSMFTYPTMFDFGIRALLRRPYIGEEDRNVGSIRFWAELDRAMEKLKEECESSQFPISHRRHPRMTYNHKFAQPKRSLPHTGSLLAHHEAQMARLTPYNNALHREWHELIRELIVLAAHLDEAAAYGDLVNALEYLKLVDNVSTSLFGLVETEYCVRQTVV